MMSILIFVEGQTEEKLLKALRVLGKIQRINLWDTDIRKFVRRIKANTKVYVVYDTDNTANIDRFNDNLSVLKKMGCLAGILQQTYNFEDELVKASSKLVNKHALFNAFDASNAAEFKTRFLQANNSLEILNRQGLNPDLLWQQPTIWGIKAAQRVDFEQLPKREL